jgi:thiol-disulfide isomerase/thioredoxin
MIYPADLAFWSSTGVMLRAKTEGFVLNFLLEPSAMKKFSIISLLVIVCAVTEFSQSGRRITSGSTAPPAPIQPSLRPEPEQPRRTEAVGLFFIPESIREREIRSITSGTFRLSDFQGKVVVINLWASWCGPCRREIPEYEKVRKAYAGREVEFIALTAEDRSATEKVNRFLRDVNFGFRVGWADRVLAQTLLNGKSAIPQTLILDGGGQIVRHWTGYSPGSSADRLKQSIDEALLRLPGR